MAIAFLIAGMAIVTYATRIGMIAILGRWDVPPLARRALHYVPIAAFAAIIAPELIERAGQVTFAVDNPRLIAGLAAILVAAVTRHTFLTIVVGMSMMWIVQFVLVR
ncbi:MAG: AzlD domain-containing protein [Chloroflexota bacterium]|nr:AzlD domain-containing protein [Chloroflexota bacterium]